MRVTRARCPRPPLQLPAALLAACNGVWALDSMLLLATGWVSPSALGYAFVIGQALVVAAFCELQVVGVRRAALQT